MMKKLLAFLISGTALFAAPKIHKAPYRPIKKTKVCPVRPQYFKGLYAGVHSGGSFIMRKDEGPVLGQDGKPTAKRDTEEKNPPMPQIGAVFGYNFAPTERLRIGIETKGIPLLTPMLNVGGAWGQHMFYGGIGYNLWMHGVLEGISSKSNKIEQDGFTFYSASLGYNYAFRKDFALNIAVSYDNYKVKGPLWNNSYVKAWMEDNTDPVKILTDKSTFHQISATIGVRGYF